ncbi:phosphodiesterase [Labrys wisconsinensis]|uniref:3',5'-cyclic AMP phosphodiesterase CpdA n=1 Tax=Labrys wisconsinensis TaxID=425677 RepID=A0ABU0JES2_9HYPH|nr:phosphodiesterase [Labrys wisconsinensis]MDQ0471913.1 3',5'-cyclic AMP phosphodiesterase CpdA [Labrys wisconsinensis]
MLIAHLTDLHVRPSGQPAYRVSETTMFTRRAVDAVRALPSRPDCLIISGDLTDCGLVEEYQLLKGLLDRLDMPVYLIPGNHDRRENLTDVFAGYPGIAPGAQRVRYAVEDHPVRLIALDTVVPGASRGELDAQSLAWLDETLAARPHAPTIVFMHHPPFDCGIRHMDVIRLLDGAEAMEAIVARHHQVERVLCGHHHRPIHRRWAGTIASTGPSVAHQVTLDLDPRDAGSMVFEPPAYQLHLWSEEAGLVTHMAYVERFPGPHPFVLDPSYPGMS